MFYISRVYVSIVFDVFVICSIRDLFHVYTLKDFKNAKNENYYFLNPEQF